MLTSAIITFREIMEACLILGIISAALKNYNQKHLVLALGIAFGVISSILIASCFSLISSAFDGLGQEILNIIIFLVAILCVMWTFFWIGNQKEKISNGITDKANEPRIIPLVLIIVSVFTREGVELVLFLSGVFAGGETYETIFEGIVLGMFAGVLFAGVTYYGLTKIPYRRFFAVINVIFILFAASMASQIASYLIAGDFVHILNYQVWDTSNILREDSIMGEIISSIVGYNSKPLALQVVFFVGTILIFLFLSKFKLKQK